MSVSFIHRLQSMLRRLSWCPLSQPLSCRAGVCGQGRDGDGAAATRCELSKFELEPMAPPAAPKWTNRQDPGKATVLTIVQPPHWKGPWHKETTVLWIVTLKGTWFIETMDGTNVVLRPGDVWLA